MTEQEKQIAYQVRFDVLPEDTRKEEVKKFIETLTQWQREVLSMIARKRNLALFRLTCNSWGVPVATADTGYEEMRSHGL